MLEADQNGVDVSTAGQTYKMLIMSSSRLMDSLSGSRGILPVSAILALWRIFWVLYEAG